MTAPAVAFSRFLRGCGLGAALGLWYGFLRPFRRRHTALGDGLFLLGVAWAWLYLGFAVCGGDLRLGQDLGLPVGGFLWEWILGRRLWGIFDRMWGQLGKIWGLIWLPLKKIWIFAKFLFASGEKWVTIKCNNRRTKRRVAGGRRHGRKETCASQRADLISAQQADYQDSGNCRYRVVYGGAVDPALGPDGH